MVCHQNDEYIVRFKTETWVMSSRLHIFAVKHLWVLGKRIGALGGNTILRGPRAIYTYSNGSIDVRKLMETARYLNCHSPFKENLSFFSPVGSP